MDCVSEFAEQGAGRPDLGLYTRRQVQEGTPRPGQVPERGVVEVKPAGDDAWLTASGDQVSRYWGRYRLVLVTNTRYFVLVCQVAQGNPVKLDTFRFTAAGTIGITLESPLTVSALPSVHIMWFPNWGGVMSQGTSRPARHLS